MYVKVCLFVEFKDTLACFSFSPSTIIIRFIHSVLSNLCSVFEWLFNWGARREEGQYCWPNLEVTEIVDTSLCCSGTRIKARSLERWFVESLGKFTSHTGFNLFIYKASVLWRLEYLAYLKNEAKITVSMINLISLFNFHFKNSSGGSKFYWSSCVRSNGFYFPHYIFLTNYMHSVLFALWENTSVSQMNNILCRGNLKCELVRCESELIFSFFTSSHKKETSAQLFLIERTWIYW